MSIRSASVAFLVLLSSTACALKAPQAVKGPASAAMPSIPESRMADHVQDELVIYAEDVATLAGNWRLEADPAAARGRRLRNPNRSAAKLTAPLATPTDYVEFQFEAQAGISYRLWLRGRAEKDNWANDSVFVQFSDSVTAAGAPLWRIGSLDGTTVNLEDCLDCGVNGWGWQDNGYGARVLGTPVRFATNGTHRLRVQRREDGFAFDQILLSSSRYLSASPGALKNAATIVPKTQ